LEDKKSIYDLLRYRFKKMSMNKLVLIMLCVFSLKTQAQSDSSRIVRVLTFNILHGATLNNDFDLDKIAKVIIDANPDLVALQEVDFKTNRAKKYDLVTELAQRTGLVPVFGRAMYFDGGEYGEGILSKFSIVQTRNVALPYDEGKEPRAALEVVVKINERDTIAFIGTHLDHTSSETRIPQVEKINEVFLQNK
jgi:endonuclease/exonuclease/phosphatase family metal-dependent hydrolase